MVLDEKNEMKEAVRASAVEVYGHTLLAARPLSSEVEVCDVGLMKCKPRHGWGAGVRNYYLFHLVSQGKGVFSVGGNEYRVSKDQAFLIRPDELISYAADERDPWHYVWLGFRGDKAAELVERATAGKHVFNVLPEYANELTNVLRSFSDEVELSYRLTAFAYKFLGGLYGSGSISRHKPDAVQTAVRFIENNYFRPFDVTELAAELGMSRTHFSTLFTQTMGVSPYNYMIKYRIAKAEGLLCERDDLSVTDIAYSVGFSSIERFSEMFKKYTSLSPLAYRKQNRKP